MVRVARERDGDGQEQQGRDGETRVVELDAPCDLGSVDRLGHPERRNYGGVLLQRSEVVKQRRQDVAHGLGQHHPPERRPRTEPEASSGLDLRSGHRHQPGPVDLGDVGGIGKDEHEAGVHDGRLGRDPVNVQRRYAETDPQHHKDHGYPPGKVGIGDGQGSERHEDRALVSRSDATPSASTKTMASQTTESHRLRRKPLPTDRMPLAGSPTNATHIWCTFKNPLRNALAAGELMSPTSRARTSRVDMVLATVPDGPRNRGRWLEYRDTGAASPAPNPPAPSEGLSSGSAAAFRLAARPRPFTARW